MKKTKEQRFKFNMKSNKGITLVSLVITIAVMLIIASVTVDTSMGRFEVNSYKKLVNDIELLQEKVESYYLKYRGLPILRDSENNPITPTTNLNFDKNEKDNLNYYIIDLEAMENLVLNYGKGFENYTNPEEKDIYVINEGSHTIYYVEGIEMSGKVYHYIKGENNNNQLITDDIPPTKPKIKIISGTQNEEGIYNAPVEIELLSGNDNLSGVEKTTYNIKDENKVVIVEETNIDKLENNILLIEEEGTYEITLKCYDNKGNVSNNSIEIILKEGNSILKVAVNQKAIKNSTINGQEYSSSNPIIPKGFAPINITGTHASSWDATDGPQVNKGLVITDNTTMRDEYGNTIGNEFVWIPVPEAEFSLFAVPQSEGSIDYKGVLDTTNTSYKEPADLTGKKTWDSATTLSNGKAVEIGKEYSYDGTDMFNLFDMGRYNNRYYQDKFNTMVASVAKYGGFYVGRYETSLNGNIAQSKAGQTAMDSVEWYIMYKNSEAYSPSGVKTEMIWGCQWDAMMRFIGDRATEIGHVSHDLRNSYATGGTDYPKDDYDDIANNIYDLEGNVYEWTQEAESSEYRVIRGGNHDDDIEPSYRSSDYPTEAFDLGSRITLYIEL